MQHSELVLLSRRLGDVKAVAEILCCDERTVTRRADDGSMPPGFKLGALRRGDLRELDDWIAAGCPRVRAADGSEACHV